MHDSYLSPRLTRYVYSNPAVSTSTTIITTKINKGPTERQPTTMPRSAAAAAAMERLRYRYSHTGKAQGSGSSTVSLKTLQQVIRVEGTWPKSKDDAAGQVLR